MTQAGAFFKISCMNSEINGKINKPEILAPAGSRQALEAAVKAGADAVYAGGPLFSARAFAGNFTAEEFVKAIEYCHLYDVKLYMAFNTLLKPEEVSGACEYMEPFYRAGLDGVIVQDTGVVKTIKENFPELPLHASTQMSISSSYGAKLLKEYGFTRIVPARELSLKEIISIKENVDIEIETFVHGAMCYAYSGRCLMSSFIGGRSGNRGRCAQPCRQLYAGNGRESLYAMSMKDMCTLEIIPQLCEAGINSFKIEGRMKKPEYVAAAVSAYRQAVDMHFENTFSKSRVQGLVRDMKDIYNRGGFSAGYYFTREGPEMLSMRRPNHDGLIIGTLERKAPPKLFIRLKEDVNPGDVLEIRGKENIELTAGGGSSGKAGELLEINGRDFGKLEPKSKVYRTRNNALIERLHNEILDKEMTLPAEAFVTARIGKPLRIILKTPDGKAFAEVKGNIIEEAANRPTGEAALKEKLGKTGGSGIRITTVQIEMDEKAFVPMSEFNELRRQAAGELKLSKK